MMPFKKFNYPKYKDIAKDIIKYIPKKTNIHKTDVFWNFANMDEIYEMSPSVREFLSEHNYTRRAMSIMHINKPDHYFKSQIHTDIDSGMVILIPIVNCEYSTTAFYEVTEDDLNLQPLRNNPEVEYYHAKQTHDKYKMIGEFSLTEPYVIDTSVAHCVHMMEPAKYPRISFGIRVHEDIRHLIYS